MQQPPHDNDDAEARHYFFPGSGPKPPRRTSPCFDYDTVMAEPLPKFDAVGRPVWTEPWEKPASDPYFPPFRRWTPPPLSPHTPVAPIYSPATFGGSGAAQDDNDNEPDWDMSLLEGYRWRQSRRSAKP